MASGTTAIMTAEEFYDFVHRPENRDRHFELEEGELVEMPPPGEKHGIACANLAWVFGNYIRQVDAGRVAANDMGLVLDRDPDTIHAPDIAVYTESKPFDDCETKYPEDLPTLAVEVLSPSDRFSSKVRRLNGFLDKGIAVVWLVDPEARSVVIWWRGQSPISFEEPAEIAELPGLPNFRCKVSDLFFTPGRR